MVSWSISGAWEYFFKKSVGLKWLIFSSVLSVLGTVVTKKAYKIYLPN